ncbi:hypothetical protein [Vulcanococcus limneticus]|uniref:hypothetical protein n=1 Tax=Vulcanococcus limneticus TaxID=2170428 RepID=UPI00398C1E4D
MGQSLTPLMLVTVLCVDGDSSVAMTPELAASVLEALLLLHEELSVDPQTPWYVGMPDQTQVLHDELWILAGELPHRSSQALVETWYRDGRSSLLPVACTGALVSDRHKAA